MNDIKIIHEKKYKYIFFDIFDTIVSRCVQPEYTKKIWANHLIKTLGLKINIIDLYTKRNILEAKIGEQSAKQGNDWEFTYESLLKELYQELKIKIDYSTFQKKATELEIEVESSVQEPDEKIIKEIKKARKAGKKIYCISDMYLSKKMLKKIFNNLEIAELFDDIFVSCEYLKSKKTGNLFEIVLEKLKAKPEQCIMIGDNYSSDYEIPKTKNIDAIHLNSTENYEKYEKYSRNYNNNVIDKKITELFKTPTDNFEHTIFTLYQFTERLYYKLINENLDEVFFLSREGEFLKKLFDQYIKVIHGKKIKTHYMIVSRKATYLPSLKSLEEEDFSGLLCQYIYISLEEFLRSLNFDKEESQRILIDYSKDCKKILETKKLTEIEKKEMQSLINKEFDTKLVYLYESNILKYLKKNSVFQEIYEKNRIEQNKLFKKYVKQFSNNKKICVVDIGWNGSIQDNIKNILGKEYEVTGYLYGLVSRSETQRGKEGLIFTNIPNRSKGFSLFSENRTIFEILLGASHGSANRYIEQNKQVEVLTYEKKEEQSIYKNVVSKIQEDMFKIYVQLLDILPNGYYDNIKLEKQINKLHFKMVFCPTKKQLDFFNMIYHYENFGVFEFSKFNLNKKISFKYYLKENLKYFIKRKSFFYDTFWPTLKLYNEKLYIQKFIYRLNKKLELKIKGVI